MPKRSAKPKKRKKSIAHKPKSRALKKQTAIVVKRTRTKKVPPSRFAAIRSLFTKPWFYIALAIFGINLILAGSLYILYSRTVLSFKVSPSVVADAHLRGPQPTQITIPSAQIDLPIVPAQIKDGIWEIPTTSAGYLYSSARPTEGGNIVVYAHNLRRLFGPLVRVKVGDTISIATDKNTIYEYTVSQIVTANPDQIELVSPTSYEVLTVYTCTGFLDSKRLVIRAFPTKVSTLSS